MSVAHKWAALILKAVVAINITCPTSLRTVLNCLGL
jgi:hypothetical protein